MIKGNWWNFYRLVLRQTTDRTHNKWHWTDLQSHLWWGHLYPEEISITFGIFFSPALTLQSPTNFNRPWVTYNCPRNVGREILIERRPGVLLNVSSCLSCIFILHFSFCKLIKINAPLSWLKNAQYCRWIILNLRCIWTGNLQGLQIQA